MLLAKLKLLTAKYLNKHLKPLVQPQIKAILGVLTLTLLFVSPVLASSLIHTTWTGSESSSSQNLTVAETVTLSATEKLSNTGFETDLTSWSAQSSAYLLNDDFSTNLAAGNVNGTAAEPGPGVREVYDAQHEFETGGGE